MSTKRQRRERMARERMVIQTHAADDWSAPSVSKAARAAEAPVERWVAAPTEYHPVCYGCPFGCDRCPDPAMREES